VKKSNLGDWGIRVGALALAFFLWFHAVTEHLYEREIDIRLQMEDPPPSDPPSREVIVASLPPTHVRVLVSGRGKDLLQLNGDGFLLRIKSEGSAGSVRTYRLTPGHVENRTTDREVKIEEIIAPKEIEISLDWRVEREVWVKPLVELEVAEAYIQVGDMGIEPQKIKIAGPSKQMRKIEFIRTDSLDLKGLREDVDYQLALQKPGGIRIDLHPTRVRVKVDIQILAEDDIAHVPVKVRHVAGGNVVPEPSRVQVKVRGGVDVIANLDPEEDLELFVDYRDFIGENLPIRAEENSSFEIVGIVPAQVSLIER